jgi:transcription initiation factor TFIIIB Brf1 subunit/transcription initiation factor TFIIB
MTIMIDVGLLIAARMHNFRRSRSEVMRIVKIGDATIKRRQVVMGKGMCVHGANGNDDG